MAGLDRSLLLVRHHKERGFGRRKQIHIWWGGMQANGGLMLLLAYLITAHRSWRDAQVKVITVVQSEAQKGPTERSLAAILEQARLEAEAAVIVREGREIAELMAAADLIVTKSGGLTTAECLAMGLPMLVRDPTPGQEERNSDYLLEAGAAVRAHGMASLAFKLRSLLEDETRRRAMRRAARRHARPNAAREIVQTMLDATT